jgi:ectoine hydroxylase-related dioxygenase (phytanoyl-CoA dioxygenase family)
VANRTHEVRRFSIDQISDAIEYYEEYGYAVFSQGFDVRDGVQFWEEVEQQIAHNERLTYSWYGQFYEGRDAPLEGKKLPRIIDIESHSRTAPNLLMAPAVSAFLKAVYGGFEPTCLQTLTYKFSSEQLAHSDKTLVSPPYAHDYDRETLAASWLALEASDERNGALVIYPGSHRGEKRGFYDGFDNSYDKYTAWLGEWLNANGFEAVTFRAEPGEILFWHGDFVHAGGSILGGGEGSPPTRKSLVCHYARIDDAVPSRDARWIRQNLHGGSYFRKLL